MTTFDSEADADVAEALELGRRLFARPCRFVIAAARLDQVPDDALPEIAFAGRSNVGKSSLVNALTGRRTLAKTSTTPGRTQQLVFFDLDGRLMMADLPGYGFAKAPKAMVDAWTRLVDAYLRGRPPLRRVLLLVDARHGLKDVDLRIMSMLDKAAVSYQVVLTKADKVRAGELVTVERRTAADVAAHNAAHPEVLTTSARDGTGIPALRAALAAFADPDSSGVENRR